MHFAKVDRCDNGRIYIGRHAQDWKYPASHPLRFGRCTKCDVRTLPWVTRRLDWSWWRSEIQIRRLNRSAGVSG